MFLVRPACYLLYAVARTGDIEKALYLRQRNVPFAALAHVFGRDPMYYYRAWVSWGRNSLVGTTVKDPTHLPEHLVADEKHTWRLGEKHYLATTVGGGILGAAKAATRQPAAGSKKPRCANTASTAAAIALCANDLPACVASRQQAIVTAGWLRG